MKNGAELERNLKTPFEGDLSAWNIHPRPQLCREAWQTLCGLWRLSVKRRDTETDVGEVRVPFPPESNLVYWYACILFSGKD